MVVSVRPGIAEAALSDQGLVDPERLAHAGLDVQRAHVLPVLLQQGDQEVDGVHNVGTDLLRIQRE